MILYVHSALGLMEEPSSEIIMKLARISFQKNATHPSDQSSLIDFQNPTFVSWDWRNTVRIH